MFHKSCTTVTQKYPVKTHDFSSLQNLKNDILNKAQVHKHLITKHHIVTEFMLADGYLTYDAGLGQQDMFYLCLFTFGVMVSPPGEDFTSIIIMESFRPSLAVGGAKRLKRTGPAAAALC